MKGLRYPVEIQRLPPAACIDARGRETGLKTGVEAAGLVWPDAMHRAARDGDGRMLIRLGPTRVLVRAPLEQEADLSARLEAAFARTPDADMALVSDMLVAFLVRGDGARDVLRQGAPLDLSDQAFPPGKAAGTELWAVTAIIMREMPSGDGFTILADNAFSGYLEDWLAVAAGLPPRKRPGVMVSPPAQVPA